MLRGGALYLIVFIAFILAVLCTLLIMTGYFSNLFFLRNTEQLRLYDNAQSGLNYLLTNREIEFNRNTEIELFDEENDLVILNKERWGIFEIYKVKAQWRKDMVMMTALVGDKSVVKEQTGLYLADHGKYLSIGGSTYLSGNTYLPKIGIRRAYIDGQVYSGSRLIYGSERRSNEKLPVPDPELLGHIVSYMKGKTQEKDSTVRLEHLWKEDNYNQSFLHRAAYVELGSNTLVDEIHCSGKIILFSRNKLVIGRNNRMEDVIIIAPHIEVLSGFEGSVQIYATDTINVGKDCTFDYPSCIGMIGNELTSPYLNIGVNSTIEGVVFVFSDNNELAQPRLIINEQATITGSTYCNGSVEHKGKVIGSLHCDELELKTPRAFYVNHLLNATVDPMSLPDYFVSRNILNPDQNMEVIKWLE